MDGTENSPDDPRPLQPGDQLGYLLVRAGELVSRPWLSGLRRQGINPRQFSVLAIVAADDGLSQAGLARRASITPQSMGELLRRLEEGGLLDRTTARRGTSATVHVTAAGRARLADAYPVVLRLNEESVASLSADERRRLAALLGKVIDQHGGL
ncbi:MarR family winged helix-turn-helix transcriptional regulator [Pseudonocardia sp. KRD291]|uniref:MarR family winged helix-turn-helix transcriptional regulator n=1 Tax=Pseudonocardia sp. KRD291 TaxID=2792007 RepID=UPI001C4A07D2|nr:MarR family transcriptional regulator [Pseudonocardia sp. KRD291]MBW0101140.1 MarR family transcriptional regulator [Pseudonocardia sp. KRD291]